jgi:hypothetical protein
VEGWSHHEHAGYQPTSRAPAAVRWCLPVFSSKQRPEVCHTALLVTLHVDYSEKKNHFPSHERSLFLCFSLDPEACSRRLFSSGVGLDYTPSGREAEAFPYYCPLCMNYYKGIFESNCCKHLVCYGCLLNYVAGACPIILTSSAHGRNFHTSWPLGFRCVC